MSEVNAIVVEGNFSEVRKTLERRGFEVVSTKFVSERENVYFVKKKKN